MNSGNHILMVTPFFTPNIGGVETHLDDLVAFLRKEGFFIHVVTHQPLTNQKAKAPLVERRDNIRIVRLPWLRLNLFYKFENKPLLQFLYLFPGIFIFGFFYLLLYARKIMNIHGHGLVGAVAALMLSKIFRKKGVASLHTIYKFAERPHLGTIVKKILSPLDYILVLAQGCKEDLVEIGIPEEKIAVYTCWVDNKNTFYQRDKRECRRKLGLPLDKFIILFVSRLSPEKGVAVVLDVVKQTISNKEMVFVLVGDGPMRSEVDSVASRYDNLIATGSIANDDLRFYYNAADILLFGSVDQDYYGRVTMEALSSGLPVILPSSAAYFGKDTMVRIDFPQGEIGYMIPPQADSVIPLLERLCKGSGEVERMAEKSRVYALEHFSGKNAEIFLRVFRGNI